MENLITVLLAIIGTLGSAAAWRFYEKNQENKFKLKKEEITVEHKDENLFISDLRTRIVRMEKLLEEASEEKDDMRKEIIRLTSETAALKAEVEYLKKENQLLKEIRSKTVVGKIKRIK